jgi:hypothetical protein
MTSASASPPSLESGGRCRPELGRRIEARPELGPGAARVQGLSAKKPLPDKRTHPRAVFCELLPTFVCFIP